MNRDELEKSWKKTIEFLLEAKSQLPEEFEDEFILFDEYIYYNELELALDVIDSIIKKSKEDQFLRVIEYMAKAALNMGLKERCRKYEEKLLKIRGWKYETII